MPGELDLGLVEVEQLARGDAQLPLDEVDSGDELGDRVLHLKARVHLHEEELVRGVGRDDELDGSRPEVADTERGVDCGPADALSSRGIEQRRRRLLDDLLVTALKRALALAEVNRRAARIGEHLNLDVSRVLDEALDEQRVVAEG